MNKVDTSGANMYRVTSELENVDASNLDCEVNGAGDNCREASAIIRALTAERDKILQMFASDGKTTFRTDKLSRGQVYDQIRAILNEN